MLLKCFLESVVERGTFFWVKVLGRMVCLSNLIKKDKKESLASLLLDIGKQFRSRSDAAECSICSGSPLFAY